MSSKSVFHLYQKIVDKIEKEKVRLTLEINRSKRYDIEKKLDELYQKESEYLCKFTKKDICDWENHYLTPFES